MITKAIISVQGYDFFDEYQHVLEHINKTNPHPKGSSRDALTHGLVPSAYYWTLESILMPLEKISDVDAVGEIHSYREMIKKGSLPPAVVLELSTWMKFYALDGSHRIESLIKENKKEVKAFIGIRKDQIDVFKKKKQE